MRQGREVSFRAVIKCRGYAFLLASRYNWILKGRTVVGGRVVARRKFGNFSSVICRDGIAVT